MGDKLQETLPDAVMQVSCHKERACVLRYGPSQGGDHNAHILAL